MKVQLLTYFCLLLFIVAKSNNLVPNSDFKNIDKKTHRPYNWDILGVPDLATYSVFVFESDSNFSVGVRLSCKFMPHTRNYRYYLLVELDEALKENISYTLRLRTKVRGGYVSNALSACLVNNRPELSRPQIMHCDNPLDFSYSGFLNSIFGRLIGKDGWEVVEVNFKAQGNEKYLIIGNFRKDGHFKLRKLKDRTEDEIPVSWRGGLDTNYWRVSGFSNLNYYLIDRVELYESGKPPVEAEPKERPKDKIAKKDDSLILSHSIQINFATASYQIDKNYYNILDSIAKDIEQQSYRLSYLSIIGHTDSIGEAEENIRLSYKRAKAVKTQLVKRGIASELIRLEGKGDTKQIGDNSTEKGRSMNRRIELFYQFKPD
jgi:outer membrane protein OmpA-like peptidoglycan-associated protein